MPEEINSLWMQRLIAGIALTFFGAATIFYLHFERGRVLGREQDRLLAQANVIAINFNQNLIALDSVLQDVQRREPDEYRSRSFLTHLENIDKAMAGVRTVAVLDATGRIISANRAALIGSDHSRQAYFTSVKTGGSAEKVYVSRPFRTARNNQALNISRVLLGSNGEFAGVVTATLDPNYFSPLLNSVRFAADVGVSLLHWDGMVFLRQASRNADFGGSLAQAENFFSYHKESGRRISFFPDVSFPSGQMRMLVLQTIQSDSIVLDKPLLVELDHGLNNVLKKWRYEVAVLSGIYLLIFVLSIVGLFASQRRQRLAHLREAAAVEAIRSSESFMKATTDALPAVVAYWTSDLRCKFANGTYLEWFGRAPRELIGTSLYDFLGPELFKKNEPFIRGALQGTRQSFERTLVKADGSLGHTWAQYIPDIDGQEVKGFYVFVSDVTPLKQAQLALAESEWKLRTIIETEPECVTILDMDGKIQQINSAGLKMLGMETEEGVIGALFADMIRDEWKADFMALMEASGREEPKTLTFELKGVCDIGRWLECHAVPMRNRDGAVSGVLCVMRDMSDWKRAEQELERLAYTDSLTGLANRGRFMSLASQELQRASRYGTPLSMMMVDIDLFKRINDVHGHKCGDAVIRKFGDVCRQSLRSLDIVGRIGGEEFAILLPETCRELAVKVADQMRETVSRSEVHTYAERRSSLRYRSA